MHFYRCNLLFCAFRKIPTQLRVRLFYTPPTGSLHAFLSSKLLCRPVSCLVMESAGTDSLLYFSDQSGIGFRGYGYFTPLRRAVCMHFYDMICLLRNLRVRLFHNPPMGVRLKTSVALQPFASFFESVRRMQAKPLFFETS